MRHSKQMILITQWNNFKEIENPLIGKYKNMANSVYTWVNIKCTDKETLKELNEKLTPLSGSYETGTGVLGERFFDYTKDDWDSGAKASECFGAKWMYCEEPEENFEDDQISVMLHSAWHMPEAFVLRLKDWLCARASDSMVWGNFEDEGIQPFGAFFYSQNKSYYQEVDHEVDYDRVWEDDEYRENLDKMRIDLEEELYYKGISK